MNLFTGLMISSESSQFEFDRNGSAIATDLHYKRSAEGLRILGDKAASLGMTIALEMHNNYLHDLPDSCRKLMDMVGHDAVGLNYDHGNIRSNKNGCSISEVFNTVGDKICYVHLKNFLFSNNGIRMGTHLEAGHIDNFELLMRLKSHGYEGPVTTEYPFSGDGFVAAKRDKEYLDYLSAWLNR
jgi:sugar phosphate isomerase/epimerase